MVAAAEARQARESPRAWSLGTPYWPDSPHSWFQDRLLVAESDERARLARESVLSCAERIPGRSSRALTASRCSRAHDSGLNACGRSAPRTRPRGALRQGARAARRHDRRPRRRSARPGRRRKGGPPEAGGPPTAVLRRYGFGGGGQCGLLLPVAPRHCLSPGPGGSASAAGATETAKTHAANSNAPKRFTLVIGRSFLCRTSDLGRGSRSAERGTARRFYKRARLVKTVNACRRRGAFGERGSDAHLAAGQRRA
jgi:hypothetical protein